MKMKFQKAKSHQLPEIMEIIAQGKAYLQRSGIQQWQNGYPSKGVIESDLAHGNSYVLTQGDHVVATSALEFGDDPNYRRIYEGSWLTTQPYAAIHRIAIDEQC